MVPGPRRVRRSQLSVEIRRASLLLSLCSLFAPAMAGAQPQPPRPPIAQYALAAWPTEKMLPGDVLTIAQDLEGYLWLGTPNGLVRFDGFRFQPWTQASRIPTTTRKTSRWRSGLKVSIRCSASCGNNERLCLNSHCWTRSVP